MKHILIIFLILFMTNTSLASQDKLVIAKINSEQLDAFAAAHKYYKDNYPPNSYNFMAIDDSESILFYFTLPSLSKMQRGGGSKSIQLVYSKKLKKVVSASEAYDR